MSLNLHKSDKELEKDLHDAENRSWINVNKFKNIGFLVLCTIPLIFVISFFGIFGYNSCQSYFSNSQLVTNGVETLGTLSEEYTEITRKSYSKVYRMSYRFKVKGQDYTGISEVDVPPKSSQITVLYDPQNPSNNKIKGGRDEYEYTTSPFLGQLVAVIIVGLIISMIRGFLTKKS